MYRSQAAQFVSPQNQNENQALAVRFLPRRQGLLRTKVWPVPFKDACAVGLRKPTVLQRGLRLPRFSLRLKRMIDVFFAALGLLLVSPFLALIAILVKLGSPGPVFYCAPRAGRNGRNFICYKFRTMIDNADCIKPKLRNQNERHGAFFKIVRDPRITPVGRFLRRYSLDEIPQLWNVLLGEMSLVGPRPHPLDDVQLYVPQDLRRLEVTPGITGLWQVTARKNPSFQINMMLDLEYIERWSLFMDLQILYRTIFAIFEGTGE